MLIGDTSKTNGNLVVLVFEERGKQSTRRKTNNKLNPHLTPGPGDVPGPHWWEVSTLTTAPSLRPCFPAPDHSSGTATFREAIDWAVQFWDFPFGFWDRDYMCTPGSVRCRKEQVKVQNA